MSRFRPSGQSRLGCVLWLAAVVVFGLIVWKVVPVKIQTAEFEDYLDDQAKFAARASEKQLRDRILQRAEQLQIPLDPKQLKIDKDPRRVRIECRYTIPIEFPFYTYVWEFEHIIDRPVFII